jgi:hypothetical protein
MGYKKKGLQLTTITGPTIATVTLYDGSSTVLVWEDLPNTVYVESLRPVSTKSVCLCLCLWGFKVISLRVC